MTDQTFDMNEIIKRLEIIEHKLGIYHIPHASAVLENAIMDSFRMGLELILRNNELKVLALAVIGFKTETLQKLKSNMSKNSWATFCEEINLNIEHGVHFGSINQSQMKILSTIYQMEEMGEIISQKVEGPFNYEEFKLKMAKLEAYLNRKEEGLEIWKKGVLKLFNRFLFVHYGDP